MQLDAWTNRAGGVTFVSWSVANGDDRPLRIAVKSRLDGIVWPPERDERNAGRWVQRNGDLVFSTTVPPAGVSVGGFASPAAPMDPPVACERIATDEDTLVDSDTGSAQVLHDCGDPRPPERCLASGEEQRLPGAVENSLNTVYEWADAAGRTRMERRALQEQLASIEAATK